LLQEAF
jgi:hypothetical protein